MPDGLLKFYQNIKNRVKMTFSSRFCHKRRNIVFSNYVFEPIDEFSHCNSSLKILDDSIKMIVSNSKNGVKMTIYPIFATRKEKTVLCEYILGPVDVHCHSYSSFTNLDNPFDKVLSQTSKIG